MDNPTIISVLKNVHKMLKNRGLDISKINRNPPIATLNNMIEMFRNNKNSLDILIENTDPAKEYFGKKAYVHFIYNMKNNKSSDELEEIYDVIRKAHNIKDTDDIIIVIFHELGETVRTLELYKDNLTIFIYKNLMFNIVDNEYVPVHELLKPEEKLKLLSDFMITSYDKLPIISKQDAVCRHFNFREGDVLRIIRPSKANKSHISYRYVQIID